MGSSATAVFIDKDGTLIHDFPYNADPARVALMPGAAEGLRLLHSAGHPLFVVTNQPGVARGRFDEAALAAIARRAKTLVRRAGAALSGFYYCPHDPAGRVAAYAVECVCRKPRAGLIRRACREHRLDPKRAWMIGDILHDVEAGRRAGCRTILIDNGGETEWRLTAAREPHFIAPDLARAAEHILDAGEAP